MNAKAKKLATLAIAASIVTALYGPQASAAESAPVAPKAKTDLELAIEKGAISGYGNGDYRADAFVTRGELVSMINRAAKLEKAAMKKAPFDDLEAWQTEAITNAAAAGIIRGNGYGHFNPNRAITKEELAVIVVGALTKGQKPNVNLEVLNYFKDKDSISEWAKPYIAYGLYAGVFDFKYESDFKPQASVTRADAAKTLKPVLFNVVDILTTNDIHGNADVFFDKKKNLGRGGMQTVAGIVNEFRNVNADGTIVLDAGDAWQGTLLSNASNGEVIMASFDKIGYDAMTVGNHEFDYTLPVLKENIQKSKTPIISANIVKQDTKEQVNWIKPSTLVERGGLKFGIIGLSTPVTESTTKSTNIAGLDFYEPSYFAKIEAEKLRAAGADIIIADTHLPGEIKDGKIVSELPQLAEATGNQVLDAIVGGHSHMGVAGVVNGVAVVEALAYTNAVGHMQLFVDKDTKQVVSRESELLDTWVNLVKADEEVKQLVSTYTQKIAEKANKVEGVAGELLHRKSFRYEQNGKQDRDGATPLGNSITDAMRLAEGSDIAFTNIGGIRADVEPGNVSYAKMFSVLPFGNYDVTGTMTAEQIKRAFEVLDKYTKLPALQFSGVKVKWDNTRAAGDKYTEIVLLDGTPVYKDGKFAERTFKVTTNDFMATGTGDGFAVFGEVKDWKDGAIMLDAWIAHFNKLQAEGKTVLLPNDGRDTRLDLQK